MVAEMAGKVEVQVGQEACVEEVGMNPVPLVEMEEVGELMEGGMEVEVANVEERKVPTCATRREMVKEMAAKLEKEMDKMTEALENKEAWAEIDKMTEAEMDKMTEAMEEKEAWADSEPPIEGEKSGKKSRGDLTVWSL